MTTPLPPPHKPLPPSLYFASPISRPPPASPIPRLPTRPARIYTPLHPLLLLVLLRLIFPLLVGDPVLTLLYAAAPVSALQMAYVVVCLPVWGSGGGGGGRGGAKGGARKTGTGNAKPQDGGFGGKIVPSILSLLLTLLLSTPPLAVTIVLFGAPLTTHHPHTLLCAIHIALLAALPLFYVHGLDARAWRLISGANLPFDTVWGGSVGAVLGAWAGAVPIPLDWDREWQKWPVTIVTGAYLGYAVGTFAGGYLFRGKRISFD